MLSMEETYKAHSQTVYRYLLSLTHNAALSEELTQETFYQAVKSVARYDGSCKVSTWLCAIAKNALRSYRRKHTPAQPLDEVSTMTGSPEAEMLAGIARVELIKKLRLLDGEMREVMYLRLFGDLSFREIGDILLRTENWARVSYYRGKEKLKKELEADGYQT
jgi:RNA polymerase sigma-70 factor (ECF subfamily)